MRPRPKRRQNNLSAEHPSNRVEHSDAVAEQPEKHEVTVVQTRETLTPPSSHGW